MGRIEDRHTRDSREDGNPLEEEFIQSWDYIQNFYKSHYNSWLKGIVLLFIAALRRVGYDRKLRAGQSLFTFVVSRSRRHGLRPEQPCIRFEFHRVTMNLFSKDEEGQQECISGVPIALLGPVKKALERLSSLPIN
jgi:hypothetical protein